MSAMGRKQTLASRVNKRPLTGAGPKPGNDPGAKQNGLVWPLADHPLYGSCGWKADIREMARVCSKRNSATSVSIKAAAID